MHRYAIEITLLKEGLPHSLLAQIPDDKVLTYYHIIMYLKEQEVNAARENQRQY